MTTIPVETSPEIDNTVEPADQRATLVTGDAATFTNVTAKICGVAEMPKPPRAWTFGFFISVFFLSILGGMIGYLFFTGVGVRGLNRPVDWAFDITNFVFWVGIGHAGTLISAILLLLRQQWRTSIARAAEAMTIFAVMCAGLFPLIHMGRPWLAFWPLPYPNSRGSLWVNFRSPLAWDVLPSRPTSSSRCPPERW